MGWARVVLWQLLPPLRTRADGEAASHAVPQPRRMHSGAWDPERWLPLRGRTGAVCRRVIQAAPRVRSLEASFPAWLAVVLGDTLSSPRSDHLRPSGIMSELSADHTWEVAGAARPAFNLFLSSSCVSALVAWACSHLMSLQH